MGFFDRIFNRNKQTEVSPAPSKFSNSAGSNPFRGTANGISTASYDPTFDTTYLNQPYLNQKITYNPYLISKLYTKLGILKRYIDEPVQLAYKDLSVEDLTIDGKPLTDDQIKAFNRFVARKFKKDIIKAVRKARLYGSSKISYRIAGSSELLKEGTIGLDPSTLAKVSPDQLLGLLIESDKLSIRKGILIENDLEDLVFMENASTTHKYARPTLSALEPITQAINSWYLCLNVATELVSEKKVGVIEMDPAYFGVDNGADIAIEDNFETALSEIENIAQQKSYKDMIAVKQGLKVYNINTDLAGMNDFYELIKANLSSATGLTASWLMGESNDGLRSTNGDITLISNYCDNLRGHYDGYVTEILVGLAHTYFRSSGVIELDICPMTLNKEEALDLKAKKVEVETAEEELETAEDANDAPSFTNEAPKKKTTRAKSSTGVSKAKKATSSKKGT